MIETMKHDDFEKSLNVKKKDLNLETLAKDVSNDILNKIETKQSISFKMLLAYQNLKTPQFRKFCKLIPMSYSVGCRQVKVAKFLQRNYAKGKFDHIESWDTLHAISILNFEEFWHFMTTIGDTGNHFT